MRLIGGDQSPFVMRIDMVLEALGCTYDRELLGTAKHREQILRYNPVGRVPALVTDDGHTIIDSHAILDYLERRYAAATTLFPQPEAERMQMLYADALGTAAMDKLVLWFYETTRRESSLRCAATVAGYEEQILAALKALSALPSQGAYLCGDKLTLADITATALVKALSVVYPRVLEAPGVEAIQDVTRRVAPGFSSTR